MNNRNLLLLFLAGAVVIGLAVLVPVLQNRQELRQHAQGPSQSLPTQAYLNPFYPTTNPTTTGNVRLPIPPEGQDFPGSSSHSGILALQSYLFSTRNGW
jgi:hypothetical protein